MNYKKLFLTPVVFGLFIFKGNAQNTFPATGNVGVGTTNPGALLDVGGTSQINVSVFPRVGVKSNANRIESLQLQNLSAGTAAEMRFITAANDGSYLAFTQPSTTNSSTDFFGASKGSGSFIFNSGNTATPRDLYLGNINNKSLYFGTNNTVKMAVLNSGNVGIGTTTPSSKLHVVSSSIAAITAEVPGGKFLQMRAGTLGGSLSFSASGVFSIGMNDAIGETSLDKTIMRFNSDGNVGIGTITPQATLETNGILRVSGLPYSSYTFPTSGKGFEMRFQTDANALTGGLTGGGGSSIFQSYDRTSATWQDMWVRGKNIVFEANGGGAGILLSSNGNVGIGNTSPQAKLDVAGNFSLLTGAHKMYVREAASFDPLQAGFRNNEGNLVVNAKNNGILFLNRDVAAETRIQSTSGSTTTDIAVFKPNGQVGIGTLNTTDINYKLFVETGIRTRKVKVDASSWADFVFEDTYKLPTIKEVEAFIKRHKHLPDIPSQSQVKEEGIDLGNNQALLLKKIEELTLYIIEQNKRIEALEEKLFSKN